MSNINCRFCRQIRQRAKEHVWPRWLQKEVFGNTNWPFAGAYVSPNFVVSEIRKHTGENLVLGDVCNICNGGWMNGIELEFRPLLNRIIKDRKSILSLNKKEKRILANWAFKTAIVINAASNYREIVPLNHFHHLHDYNSVPKDVKIDISFIESEEKLSWIQAPIMITFGKEKLLQNNTEWIRNNNYCIALQIYNLGIRVSWLKDCKENEFELESIHNTKTLRIWPYMKNGLFKLNESYNSIEAFHPALIIRR